MKGTATKWHLKAFHLAHKAEGGAELTLPSDHRKKQVQTIVTKYILQGSSVAKA